MVEFDHFKMQAGLPSFVLSASEWIEKTNAIGIVSKRGRYGGTYAHRDIAFEYGQLPQGERLVKLNQIAIQQMQILEDIGGRKLLK